MKKNSFPSILFGSVISALLLILLFRYVDLKATYDAIHSANYFLLFAAACVHVFWLMVRARAWQSIIVNSASYKDAFVTLGEGYLLNNILPFRLGEIGRAFLLGRKTYTPFFEIIPSIIVERFLDLVISFILLIALLPTVLSENSPTSNQTLVAIFIIIFLCFISYVLLTKKSALLISIIKTATRSLPKLQQKALKMLDSLTVGFSVIGNFSTFFRFFSLIFLAWVVDTYLFYLILLAFFPEATLIWGGFVLVATAWGSAIPSLPGSVGTLEASVTGAIVLLAGNEFIGSAVAVSLVIRLFMYFFSGIIGSYGLYHEQETLSAIYNRLKVAYASL